MPIILWVWERSAPQVPGLEGSTGGAPTPGSKAPGGPPSPGWEVVLSSSTNPHAQLCGSQGWVIDGPCTDASVA